MTVHFEDYDGNYIASMTADELPNLMDFITIKTECKRIYGKVIAIGKEYDTIRNSVTVIVSIDYRILK